MCSSGDRTDDEAMRPHFRRHSQEHRRDGVVNYAQWQSHEDFEAMTRDESARRHMEAAARLASVRPDPVRCGGNRLLGDYHAGADRTGTHSHTRDRRMERSVRGRAPLRPRAAPLLPHGLRVDITPDFRASAPTQAKTLSRRPEKDILVAYGPIGARVFDRPRRRQREPHSLRYARLPLD